MPYGLPAATVVEMGGYFEPIGEGAKVFVPTGSHVEIVAGGADQDGWIAGEILTRFKGSIVGIPRHKLKLAPATGCATFRNG